MPEKITHQSILDKLTAGADTHPTPAEFLGSFFIWTVRSETEESLVYYVMEDRQGNIICTCDGWRYTDHCKHIKTVRGGI